MIEVFIGLKTCSRDLKFSSKGKGREVEVGIFERRISKVSSFESLSLDFFDHLRLYFARLFIHKIIRSIDVFDERLGERKIVESNKTRRQGGEKVLAKRENFFQRIVDSIKWKVVFSRAIKIGIKAVFLAKHNEVVFSIRIPDLKYCKGYLRNVSYRREREALNIKNEMMETRSTIFSTNQKNIFKWEVE